MKRAPKPPPQQRPADYVSMHRARHLPGAGSVRQRIRAQLTSVPAGLCSPKVNKILRRRS